MSFSLLLLQNVDNRVCVRWPSGWLTLLAARTTPATGGTTATAAAAARRTPPPPPLLLLLAKGCSLPVVTVSRHRGVAFPPPPGPPFHSAAYGDLPSKQEKNTHTAQVKQRD